jgi:MFS family permease
MVACSRQLKETDVIPRSRASTASGDFWDIPLIGSVGTSIGGSMLFVLVPILVEGLRAGEGFSARDAGLVASAGTFGMFLGAIGALVLIGAGRRRLAWWGALALLVGNSVCMAMATVPALIAACILAGGGGGLMLGVGHAAMSQSSAPERAYALFLVGQTLLASLLIFALSRFGSPGHAGVFAASTFCLLLTLPALFWLPEPAQARPAKLVPPFPIKLGFAALIVFTFMLWGTSLLAAWSFTETIARQNGLSAAQYGSAVSVALVGGMVSALAIVALGRRIGRIKPLLLIGLPYFVAMVMFALSLDASSFVIAAFLFQTGIQAASYVFGACVEIEDLGRPGILYLLGLKAGFALGPVTGALIVEGGSVPALLLITGIGGMASFALFVLVIRLAVRQRQA